MEISDDEAAKSDEVKTRMDISGDEAAKSDEVKTNSHVWSSTANHVLMSVNQHKNDVEKKDETKTIKQRAKKNKKTPLSSSSTSATLPPEFSPSDTSLSLLQAAPTLDVDAPKKRW